jgi:hypothetical protein
MRKFQLIEPPASRYLRTTWKLNAKVVLTFPDTSKVRHFTETEANSLAAEVQRRNVFARHARENSFYVQRAISLAGQTVIEVFRPGDTKTARDEVEAVATFLERIVLLATTFTLSKKDLHRRLGVRAHAGNDIDFIVGSDLKYVGSRSRTEHAPLGIVIDERFRSRFVRCGFDVLGGYSLSTGDFPSRVRASMNWLFESRVESRLEASVVKSAIALETLLIFSESESVAQNLAERAAFILSENPDHRLRISRIIKRFYEARSGVVHGSRKKAKRLTLQLVEIVDRLLLVLHLTIASNSTLWPNHESIQRWCEFRRWGAPLDDLERNLPKTYVTKVMSMIDAELQSESERKTASL